MTATEFEAAGFIDHVVDYARSIPHGERRIVAIAGPPASGKSTLADAIWAHLDSEAAGSCALLPMDGFHYDDEVLVPRGWRPRKGAPHTFDVGGYATALRRLRANDEESVAVPRFDRSIEIARAGAIIIERSVRLVITEGLYLLLDMPPWSALRTSFDRSAFLALDMATLEARNRQRWVDIDMPEEGIRAKLEDNDMPNARFVLEHSGEPDWIVRT